MIVKSSRTFVSSSTMHLDAVVLAVEGGGEEQDVEDDADGVQHAQLRDQPPERELQPQLRAVDHHNRHQVACADKRCQPHFANVFTRAFYYQ